MRSIVVLLLLFAGLIVPAEAQAYVVLRNDEGFGVVLESDDSIFGACRYVRNDPINTYAKDPDTCTREVLKGMFGADDANARVRARSLPIGTVIMIRYAAHAVAPTPTAVADSPVATEEAISLQQVVGEQRTTIAELRAEIADMGTLQEEHDALVAKIGSLAISLKERDAEVAELRRERAKMSADVNTRPAPVVVAEPQQASGAVVPNGEPKELADGGNHSFRSQLIPLSFAGMLLAVVLLAIGMQLSRLFKSGKRRKYSAEAVKEQVSDQQHNDENAIHDVTISTTHEEDLETVTPAVLEAVSEDETCLFRVHEDLAHATEDVQRLIQLPIAKKEVKTGGGFVTWCTLLCGTVVQWKNVRNHLGRCEHCQVSIEHDTGLRFNQREDDQPNLSTRYSVST